jgi:hypothetical protein
MSQLIHHQDPITDLTQVFDAAFRFVLPSPGRGIVGFKGISEKLQGAPGWYLWLEDRPGAYLLELVEAETVTGADGGSPGRRDEVRGTYWIKYYPAADDHSSLAALSRFERTVRGGGCFDATGTPDFDRGCDIPAASFLIGALETTLGADGNGLVLHLESPDHWITSVREQKGAEAGVTERRDRDVPAWDWSWFLLDRLILTLCLGYRTAPRRVSLYEEPGHAFHIAADGAVQAIPDDAVHGLRLSASFTLQQEHGPACPDNCHTHRPDVRTNPPASDAGRPLFSCAGEPTRPTPWVSPAWWHIRERHAEMGGALPC